MNAVWKDGIYVILRAARRGAVYALDPEEERIVEALLMTAFHATEAGR